MRLRLLVGATAVMTTLALGTHLAVAGSSVKPAGKHTASHKVAKPACTPLKVAAPNTMAGLKVTAENPCSTYLEARGDRALDAVALLGLRGDSNLLMATLEIGHFRSAAPLNDAGFRSEVLQSIGDLVPRPLVVGGQTVEVSASPGLVLVSWIRGNYLYVLALRDTYATPKELLRVALKVQG